MGSKYVGTTVVLLAIALLLALPASAQLSKKQEKINAQHADAIAAARTAAEAWLKIEDAETYEKSWSAASDYFRAQVPEQGWVRHMTETRKPLDPLLVRDLTASEWNTEMPNLPKGEYVAFVYQSTFANGHPQLESIVMVHEGGAWKMVGYAVQ
jgi:Tfp pilus assembly protein FimT